MNEALKEIWQAPQIEEIMINEKTMLGGGSNYDGTNTGS